MSYKSPTEINWSKGFDGGVSYINEVSPYVMNFILIGVYIFVLWAFSKKQDDFIGGLAVAGFSIFLVGLIMWIAGWVSWITFSFCLGAVIIGVAAILIDGK